MKQSAVGFSSLVHMGCKNFVVIVAILCVVNQIHGTEGLSKDGLVSTRFQEWPHLHRNCSWQLEGFRCIAMQLGRS